METLWQDIKYGLRTLAGSPGFTAVALLTLAVGIGANVAIYSFIDTVLLNPLPARDPKQLIQIRALDKERGQYRMGVSPPTIMELRRHDGVFSELAVFENHSITYPGDQFQERLRGNKVSANFFDFWDVAPELGRTFAAHEGQPGRDNVVVLSHGYWMSRFGGRTDILGETIHFNEVDLTVVGVMPTQFQVPYANLNYWVAGEAPNLPDAYTYRDFGAVARLRPGITLDRAQAMLDTIAMRRAQDHPEGNRGFGITARPLRRMFASETIHKTLLSLMGAVIFILLIVCANLANLLFARAENRKRELAVRYAMGAGKRRLLRQLLTENVVLAVLGGLCGLLVTSWGIAALTVILPANLPQLKPVQIRATSLAMTVAVSVAIGIVFGLVPAWFSCRGQVGGTLKQSVSAASPNRMTKRLNHILVASEVALAIVLLSGAGLMISSVVSLLRVDPGYDPARLIRVHLTLPWDDYQDIDKKNLFFEQLHERWSSVPGVESVGIGVSYGGQKPETWIDQNGNTWDVRRAGCGTGDANFLRTMRAGLITGRYLEDRDIGEDRRTIVINERMARSFGLGEDPVGRTIARVTDEGQTHYEVAGVVSDLREYTLNQPIEPVYYRPYQEIPMGPPQFVSVRTTVEPESVLAGLRRELKDLEPAMNAPSFEFVADSLYRSTASHRVYMKCLMLSAGVGLGLAVLGIYGVLAYSVTRRTKEMGIRIALGALASDIVRHTVMESVKVVLLGVAIGLLGTFWLSRFIESLLFGVSPHDPLSLAGAVVLFIAVAAVAAWIPARRAARIDPMEALRYE